MPPAVPALVLLAAGTAVGIVFSLDPERSLKTVLKAAAGVLLVVALWRALSRGRLTLDGLVSAWVVVTVLALLSFVASQAHYGGYLVRPAGILPGITRNAQAVTLLVLLAATLALCRFDRRLVTWLAAIALLWMLFANAARGAQLAALAIGGLAVARALGWRMRTILLLALSGIALAAIAVWHFHDTLAAARGGNLLTGRDYLWRAALQVIADHPLAGIGINTWKYSAYVDALAAPWVQEAGPHNIVLDLLTATGIVGALLTLAGLASWMRSLTAGDVVVAAPLREFGLLLAAAMLVNGMVDFRVWSVQFIGLLGIALVLWRTGFSAETGERR